MNYKNEIQSIFRRVMRVSATFFVLSIITCSLALVFGVPTNELGAAVAVPILWLFAISRIFVLALPTTPPPERPIRQIVLFVAAAWVLSGIGAIDFFLSALTFSWLRLAELASQSYALAGMSGEGCAALMLLIVLLVMQEVFNNLAAALVFVVRSMLKWPGGLADALSLPAIQHHR